MTWLISPIRLTNNYKSGEIARARLRFAPRMAVGVMDHLWEIEDIVAY